MTKFTNDVMISPQEMQYVRELAGLAGDIEHSGSSSFSLNAERTLQVLLNWPTATQADFEEKRTLLNATLTVGSDINMQFKLCENFDLKSALTIQDEALRTLQALAVVKIDNENEEKTSNIVELYKITNQQLGQYSACMEKHASIFLAAVRQNPQCYIRTLLETFIENWIALYARGPVVSGKIPAAVVEYISNLYLIDKEPSLFSKVFNHNTVAFDIDDNLKPYLPNLSGQLLSYIEQMPQEPGTQHYAKCRYVDRALNPDAALGSIFFTMAEGETAQTYANRISALLNILFKISHKLYSFYYENFAIKLKATIEQQYGKDYSINDSVDDAWPQITEWIFTVIFLILKSLPEDVQAKIIKKQDFISHCFHKRSPIGTYLYVQPGFFSDYFDKRSYYLRLKNTVFTALLNVFQDKNVTFFETTILSIESSFTWALGKESPIAYVAKLIQMMPEYSPQLLRLKQELLESFCNGTLYWKFVSEIEELYKLDAIKYFDQHKPELLNQVSRLRSRELVVTMSSDSQAYVRQLANLDLEGHKKLDFPDFSAKELAAIIQCWPITHQQAFDDILHICKLALRPSTDLNTILMRDEDSNVIRAVREHYQLLDTVYALHKKQAPLKKALSSNSDEVELDEVAIHDGAIEASLPQVLAKDYQQYLTQYWQQIQELLLFQQNNYIKMTVVEILTNAIKAADDKEKQLATLRPYLNDISNSLHDPMVCLALLNEGVRFNDINPKVAKSYKKVKVAYKNLIDYIAQLPQSTLEEQEFKESAITNALIRGNSHPLADIVFGYIEGKSFYVDDYVYAISALCKSIAHLPSANVVLTESLFCDLASYLRDKKIDEITVATAILRAISSLPEESVGQQALKQGLINQCFNASSTLGSTVLRVIGMENAREYGDRVGQILVRYMHSTQCYQPNFYLNILENIDKILEKINVGNRLKSIVAGVIVNNFPQTNANELLIKRTLLEYIAIEYIPDKDVLEKYVDSALRNFSDDEYIQHYFSEILSDLTKLTEAPLGCNKQSIFGQRLCFSLEYRLQYFQKIFFGFSEYTAGMDYLIENVDQRLKKYKVSIANYIESLKEPEAFWLKVLLKPSPFSALKTILVSCLIDHQEFFSNIVEYQATANDIKFNPQQVAILNEQKQQALQQVKFYVNSPSVMLVRTSKKFKDFIRSLENAMNELKVQEHALGLLNQTYEHLVPRLSNFMAITEPEAIDKDELIIKARCSVVELLIHANHPQSNALFIFWVTRFDPITAAKKLSLDIPALQADAQYLMQILFTELNNGGLPLVDLLRGQQDAASVARELLDKQYITQTQFDDFNAASKPAKAEGKLQSLFRFIGGRLAAATPQRDIGSPSSSPGNSK
jgi:hypothetical protein